MANGHWQVGRQPSAISHWSLANSQYREFWSHKAHEEHEGCCLPRWSNGFVPFVPFVV